MKNYLQVRSHVLTETNFNVNSRLRHCGKNLIFDKTVQKLSPGHMFFVKVKINGFSRNLISANGSRIVKTDRLRCVPTINVCLAPSR